MVAFERPGYADAIGVKEVVAAWTVAGFLFLAMMWGTNLAFVLDRGSVERPDQAATTQKPERTNTAPRLWDGRTVCPWPECLRLKLLRGIDV